MFGRKEFFVLFLVTIALLAPVHSKFKFRKKKYHREEYSSQSSSDFKQKASRSGNTNNKEAFQDVQIQLPILEVDKAETSINQGYQAETVDQCAEKPYYDYNVLVFMWPKQYCQETDDCNSQWEKEWDRETPLLRGYWPASGQPYYYECFADSDSAGDPFCQHQAFGSNENIQQFLNDQINYLKEKTKQWYPFPKDGQNKYYHEQWLRHGSCYLANMIQDNPKVYEHNPEEFNRTIFREYFNNGIEKAKKLDLTLDSEQKFFSKEDFAKRIGFEGKQDHFNLICGDDNEVDEIHICYNRTRIPGKETTVECPNYENCDKHKFFILP